MGENWAPTYDFLLTFVYQEGDITEKGYGVTKVCCVTAQLIPEICEIVSDSALQIPKTPNASTIAISRLVCRCGRAKRPAYT
jgi:hypothetical protein